MSIVGLILAWSVSTSVAVATTIASVGESVLCNAESSELPGVRWTEDGRDVRGGLSKLDETRTRIKELREMQRKFAAIELLLSDQLGVMRRYLSGMQPEYSNGSHHVGDDEDDSIEGTNYWEPKTSSLYVRWGGIECPRTAMKLYEGIVGGAWSLKQGEEVDSQCLPTNPSFLTLESDIHQSDDDDIHKERISSRNAPYLSHGTPCAVCRIALRPTVRMHLGRTNCTSHDWTLEYTGSVMTCLGNHGDNDEYLCVDDSLHENNGANLGENMGASVDNIHKQDLRTCAVCTK